MNHVKTENMERIFEAFHDLLCELNIDAHEEIMRDICGHELLKDIECNMDLDVKIESIQEFMELSDIFKELVSKAVSGYKLSIEDTTKMVGLKMLIMEYLRVNKQRNKYIETVLFAVANFDEIEYSYFDIY